MRDAMRYTELNNSEFESQWGFRYTSTAHEEQRNQILYKYLITYDNS